MVTTDQVTPSTDRQTPNLHFAKFYRAAWRWHFYAGLYVIPFFIMLATTGMLMMWIAFIDGRDGERTQVTPQEAPLAVSIQAQAALEAIPSGNLVQYVAPRADDLAAIFRIDRDGEAMMVVLDPYTAKVLDSFPRRSGLYDLLDNIHGSLLLGVTGDRMIEIAASLGMILIATGLFMWWPRAGAGPSKSALRPNLAAGGRSLWKSLHSVVGFWSAAMLVIFLISGLSWAGVWGEKMVQAWSSFPAQKWGAPLSDVTHASMNEGPKEVPWVLEQTPMPASGSLAGKDGIAAGVPVTLDSIDALARAIGFEARYQLNLPKGDTGVWTMSRDSMNTDSVNPMSDRTVHIDQYSGKILADVKFADYGWMGKAMAVGIAFHMGTVGLPIILLNSVFCLSIVFLCISGVVMWLKRRPAGQKGLVPPPAPRDMPLWKGAVVLALVLGAAFPMAGLAMIFALAIDFCVISPLVRRKRATI
ncbi:putative iron-regulated membrane protein [Pacificibacter maritimus]|uniref:Putative iron-regulated membrane protein n=1 Tax=Pacificibacter maritimus TaxID=762213 RepID=A0A3N4UKT4_9RHOB|nr:PepSY domain-containing protein [Pacificibacter maritimus]RPE71053.1 putative iron-regulated membrane protein [Pacificibacter maritimus]